MLGKYTYLNKFIYILRLWLTIKDFKASNLLLLNSSPGTKRITVKWSVFLILVSFLPTFPFGLSHVICI